MIKCLLFTRKTRGAICQGAILRWAILRWAIFQGAICWGAILRGQFSGGQFTWKRNVSEDCRVIVEKYLYFKNYMISIQIHLFFIGILFILVKKTRQIGFNLDTGRLELLQSFAQHLPPPFDAVAPQFFSMYVLLTN